jgi:hypothetical protein
MADPEAEQTYRTQQSAEMMHLLRSMLRRAEMSTIGGPEEVVQQLSEYVRGWADAFTRTAPDLADELASEVEGVMCSKGSSDTQLLLMSQLILQIPELGSARSFDCVFERDAEDSVLWETLAAFREADLPQSDALSALAAKAKDERTQVALQHATEEPQEESEGMNSAPPPPAPSDLPQPEVAPLQQKDVLLALRHAQRMGNAESEKALAAVLEQMKSPPSSP